MSKELEVGDEVAAYDGRVGKVTKISRDHAVVCFPEPNPKQVTYTEEWRICDLGRKVNTVPTTDLKVGDRVKIADDSQLARRVLKESNAGYGDYKFEMFGSLGTVISADPPDRASPQYKVDVGTGSESAWWWPSVLLTKLPDEKTWIEMMEAVANCADPLRKPVEFGQWQECPESEDMFRPPKCVPLKCRCVVDPAPKMRNTKTAEIVFDHVVVDGKCMLEIAEINGVSVPSELPVEYKNAHPCMELVLNGLWVHYDGTARRYFVGQLLTEVEAAKLVKKMKTCGERLHKINAAARAEKDKARFEAWKAKGRKTVKI